MEFCHRSRSSAAAAMLTYFLFAIEMDDGLLLLEQRGTVKWKRHKSILRQVFEVVDADDDDKLKCPRMDHTTALAVRCGAVRCIQLSGIK